MSLSTIEHGRNHADPPHLPLIITGLSGGGKSTVATLAQQYAEEHLSPDLRFSTYNGRVTTRPLRPGEIEGVDGHFGLSPDQFDQMGPDLFYQYAKYGERYGFSRNKLRACLANHNTFIIGGEPDTSADIKHALNSDEEHERLELPALKAVTIYIQRPLKEILLGIVDREAHAEERLKRIRHVVEKYDSTHMADGPFDYLVMNGRDRLEGAVNDMIGIVKSERTKQIKELFGNSCTSVPPDYARTKTA